MHPGPNKTPWTTSYSLPQVEVNKGRCWDFPGGPVVCTSSAGDLGPILGQGNSTCCTVQPEKKKKKQVHPHPCLLDFFTWMLTEHLRPNKGKAGPTYARCPSILTISAIPFFYMLRSKTSKSSIMPLLLSYPTSNFSAKTCLPIYNMYSKSSHFLQPLQFTTLVPATASLPISLLSP